MRPTQWLCVSALALGVTGCGGDNGHPDADHNSPDAPRIGDGPQYDARTMFDNLDETGLCMDPGCMTISPDVQAYAPRFALWSDAATKQRWIYLPPGTQIDTTDMDYWQFPVGTKLWKEFTSGPTRVETRLIQKIGPMSDDWVMTPYIWNATQDMAVATPIGQPDANGTQHDVPSRAECKQCHDRAHGDVLGFSAIQLDYDAGAGNLDLEGLVAMNALTAPPAGLAPHFPLPGSADDQAMLGYVHANCGHCHNPTSDVFEDITTIDMRMRVGLLATTAMTPLWTSTINVAGAPPINGATVRVVPMDTAASILWQRFTSTNPSVHMPKLGSEIMDPAGLAAIETWINGLPP